MEKVRGEAVPQQMREYAFGQAGAFGRRA